MRLVVVCVLLLCACDHWNEQHAARCASWMQRAQNKSDSLNVEMTCAAIAQSHSAEVTAATYGALNAGIAASK